MPRKTLVTAREKDAKDYKKPKDRVTLMVCVNVTGSIKFKNLDKASLPAHYYAHRNSWMDSQIKKNVSMKNLYLIARNC